MTLSPPTPSPVAAGGSGANGVATAPADAAAATVNGSSVPFGGLPAHTNALDWLRSAGLTGAKEGCAEGECGACAIMVARPDGSDRTQWISVNACLVPAASLDGQEIVTSEGLGSPDALHPVQHEMAVRGGSQCGYCTPGFICSMAAEFYRVTRWDAPQAHDGNGSSSEQRLTSPIEPLGDSEPPGGSEPPGDADDRPDVEHGANGFALDALSGNLCRCTGYRPIRDAAYALGHPEPGDPMLERLSRPAPAAVATRFTSPSGTYARAADLADALALLAEHPEATLVSGATDWGVDVNLRGVRAPFVIGLDRILELRTLELTGDLIEIGAALTLTEVEAGLRGRVPLLSHLFPQFASPLIRNGATIGGNLGTASPIGDTPPALLALEAGIVLTSGSGERVVALSDYFTGYRKTVKRADELIRAVRIPLPLSPITAFHKLAKRRYDDISSVAIGLALRVEDGIVRRARIGLGGIAATPIRALATEAALEGASWTRDGVAAAAAVMHDEGTPMDDHRASSAYRATMLGTALLRLQAETSRDLEVRP
ncbi:MAG: FAD binding domain-containing protein [Dermatophilaceae bacterium]